MSAGKWSSFVFILVIFIQPAFASLIVQPDDCAKALLPPAKNIALVEGDLEITSDMRVLWKGQEVLAVVENSGSFVVDGTTLLYQLLVFLVERKNQYVSFEELAALVYPSRKGKNHTRNNKGGIWSLMHVLRNRFLKVDPFFSNIRMWQREGYAWDTSERAQTVEVNGILLSPAVYGIQYRGEWLQMTPAQFRVLSALLSKPGKTYSFRDIYGLASGEHKERLNKSAILIERSAGLEIHYLRQVFLSADPAFGRIPRVEGGFMWWDP